MKSIDNASSGASDSKGSASSSKSTSDEKKPCNCKKKISSADFKMMTHKLEVATKDESSMLHQYNVRRDTFKNKKLSKYFVEKLLKKLEIDEELIRKCIQVPLSSLAKVIEISHRIVSGKEELGQLISIKDLLCEELKIIPTKLKNPKIFNNVKNYLNTHVNTSK